MGQTNQDAGMAATGTKPDVGTTRDRWTNSAGKSDGEVLSQPADIARQAVNEVGRAVSETACAIVSSTKDSLSREVGRSADLVGHIAHSVRQAAEDLDDKVPQVAGMVRGAADRIDAYSRDLRGVSIDRLASAIGNFARRQPVLALGAAALVGFFAYRIMAAASSGATGPNRDAYGIASR